MAAAGRGAVEARAGPAEETARLGWAGPRTGGGKSERAGGRAGLVRWRGGEKGHGPKARKGGGGEKEFLFFFQIHFPISFSS